MYLHTKFGFVEIDRWDGQAIGLPAHDRLIGILSRGGTGVFVIRARAAEVVRDLLENTLKDAHRKFFESPPSWDYQFRVYVTGTELERILAGVVKHLDYRNFKSWTARHSTESEAALAKAVWHAAHAHGKR